MIPIPTPDPMPLPAPVWLLKSLLLLLFFLHVLFMNVVLGGGTLAAFAALRRRKSAFFAHLSRDLAAVLPACVSFAVTLGVAALLFLQTLFGNFFYASSILIGVPWLSVIGLLIIAYYGFYTFSFKGDRRIGVAAGTIAAALVIWIGFTYSNNMTLMLTPERWLVFYQSAPNGLHLNLGERSLWPRFLHMYVSALAVASLFTAILSQRKRETEYGAELLQFSTLMFAATTIINYGVGFWFLAALPRNVRMMFFGQDTLATTLLAVSVFLPMGALLHLFLAGGGRKPKLHLSLGIGAALLTVAFMVIVRDMVRTAYLRPHFSTSQLTVAPQWSVIALFLVTFVACLAVLAWMLRKVAVAQHAPVGTSGAVSAD